MTRAFEMGQIQFKIPQNRLQTGSKGPKMAQIIQKEALGTLK